MKNWQGIPTTHLTLDSGVMVPRDNSTLAFSTELLNYIIAFATKGYFSLDDFYAWAACNGQNSKE